MANYNANTFSYLSKKHKVCPQGKVIDKNTGKPIANAKIDVFNPTKKTNNIFTVYSNSRGEFKFNPIPSIEYVYKIIISAKNYGSKVIDFHTAYKCEYTVHKLEPKGKGKLVDCKHLGKWKYNKKGDTYYFNNGVAENRDNYFFPRTKFEGTQELLEELKKDMGLTNAIPKNDAEVYEIFRKVWAFWKKHKRDGMRDKARTKEAGDFLFPKSPGIRGRWPSIEEYAISFYKFGYFAAYNCSASSIQFANLLSITNIPKDQVAIEVMYSKKFENVEHWSVILKIYGTWFWFDPQATWTNVPAINYRKSIPYDAKLFYANPFKIIRFPGETNLKVPLCEYQ